jgi:hypothetical protein
LQSESTTVESAVSSATIDSVPNVTQNPLYYAMLLEGVVGRSEMGDVSSATIDSVPNVTQNTGWQDGPGAYNMGSFAAGTQNLPYGTSPNGTLVGNSWDTAASPVIPPVGANSSAAQIYGTGLFFLNAGFEIWHGEFAAAVGGGGIGEFG